MAATKGIFTAFRGIARAENHPWVRLALPCPTTNLRIPTVEVSAGGLKEQTAWLLWQHVEIMLGLP